MRPLAIIEQDSTTSKNLLRSVEAAGFRADCFPDSASALSSLRQRPFSLAILDLDLRDDDPFAVCREMSRLVPVITISAEGDEDVRVRAFEAGADDCVTHTLTARELIARVRNILRRASSSSDTCELDALSISLREMRVRSGGAVHELSRGETEILALLLEHSPAPLTPADMAKRLPAKRSTIESRIKSLRKKLGPGRLLSRGTFGYVLK
jgi:DNA-binding response OmpR family regulator